MTLRRFKRRPIDIPTGGGGSNAKKIVMATNDIPADISLGVVVGKLSFVGGTTPVTYQLTNNSKFTVNGDEVVRTSIGTLSAGVFETFMITAVDVNGKTAKKSFSLTIVAAAVTPPPVSQGTDPPANIQLSSSTVNINAIQGTQVGQLSYDGGNGVQVWSTTNNKFQFSSTSAASPYLERSATGTLLPNTTESCVVQVQDSLGRVTSETFSIVVESQAVTSISLSSNTVDPNAANSEVIGTLSYVGGIGTQLWEILDNTKFKLSSSSTAAPTLQRSATGVLTPGGSENLSVRVTSGGVSATRVLSVSVDTLPSSLTISNNSIVENDTAGHIVGTLSATGGKLPYTWSVTNNTDFTVSGSNLTRSATGTITGGINEAVNVEITDANGNTEDADLTITVIDVLDPPPVPATDNFVTVSLASPNATYPLQFARLFREGELTGGVALVVNDVVDTTSSHKIIDTYSDGSVKHARVGTCLNLSGTEVIGFTDDVNDTTALTKAEMLADFNFDCEIRFTKGSTVVSVSARDMLNAGLYDVLCSGPSMTEIDIHMFTDQSRTFATGFDSFKSIDPHFRVTFWPDRGDYCVNRWGYWNGNSTKLGDVGDVDTIQVFVNDTNPKLVYSDTPNSRNYAVSYAGTFVARGPYWSGTAPTAATFDKNPDYLCSIPGIRNMAGWKHLVTPAVISSLKTQWNAADKEQLYKQGIWSHKSMNSFNPDNEWDPYPSVLALLSSDPEVQEIAEKNAMLAGSWRVHCYGGNPAHFYDEAHTVSAYGKPHSVYGAYPSERLFRSFSAIPLHNDGSTSLALTSGIGWEADNQHTCRPWYLLYLLTGDPLYLRASQQLASMWGADAAQNNIMDAPSNHNIMRVISPPILAIYGARAVGMYLRNVAAAYYMSPRSSPEKAYNKRLVEDHVRVHMGWRDIPSSAPVEASNAYLYGQIAQTTAPMTGFPSGKTIQFMPQNFTYWVDTTPLDEATHLVHGATFTVSHWQSFYQISAVGEAIDLCDTDIPELQDLMDHWAVPWVELAEGMLLGTYPVNISKLYRTPYRPGGTGAVFTSWAQIIAEWKPDYYASQIAQLSGNYPVWFTAMCAYLKDYGGLSDAAYDYISNYVYGSSFYQATDKFKTLCPSFISPRT